MRGFNRVIIAGNLTKDPDVRSTVNKNTFARLGVAINNQRKDANGTWQDYTEYVNVLAWGATAENCGKYLKKGSAVLIEGRLQTSTYEAKDGSGKRISTEVVADTIRFLGSAPQGGNYSRNSAPQQRQPQNNQYMPPSSEQNYGTPITGDGFGGFSPDFLDGTETPGNDIPF